MKQHSKAHQARYGIRETVRVYLKESVVAAARKRIEHCFRHFDIPIVSFSGGKDSLAMILLAVETMRPYGVKPYVLFIDEEFVMPTTVRFAEWVMYESEWAASITPLWGCWQLESELYYGVDSKKVIQWDVRRKNSWMRPIREGALVDFENVYDVYTVAIPLRRIFRSCSIGLMLGIRTQESLMRYMGISTAAKMQKTNRGFPWICHSASKTVGVWHAKPIYDWKTMDVYKFLQEHNVINPIYREMMLATVGKGQTGRVDTPMHGRRCNIGLYRKIDPVFVDRLIKEFPEVHGAIVLNDQVKRFSELAHDSSLKYGNSVRGLVRYVTENMSDAATQQRALQWVRIIAKRWQGILKTGRFDPHSAIEPKKVWHQLVSRNFDKAILPRSGPSCYKKENAHA